MNKAAPVKADSTEPAAPPPGRPSAGRGTRDLTTGPIVSTLILFTLPTLFSNILQSLNGSINSIWVAHFLGEAALAATANANIIMFLMLSVVFGFGMAANVIVGQAFGKGDIDSARRAFGSAVGFCLALTVIVSVAGALWASHILALLSTPKDVFDLAVQYLHYTFLGLPAGMIFIMVMMGMRGGGDAMTPLWFMIVSVTLDVLLNPVFILGLGPFPQMGIAGAAFASAISRYISLGAMLLYIYRFDLPLRLRGPEWRYLLPDIPLLKIIAGRGIPMGLQMIIMSLSMLVIIGFVNREGTMTLAAYAASQQIWNYIQMPAMAVGGAVSAMAAQNIGADRWDRVEHTTRIAVVINMVMTGLLIGLVMLFDKQVLGLFLTGGGNAIEIGQHMMNIVNWNYFLFGIAMVLFGTMRANGIVIAPLIILSVSLFVVRIGFYFVSYPIIGVDGLWWSFPISSAVSLVLAWIYYRWGKWRETSLMDIMARTVAPIEAEA